MEKINVLYASDDNFVSVLGTSLYSLYEYNQKNNIHVYIISQKILDDNKNKLKQIAQMFHRGITLIEQPDLEKIIGKRIDIQRYSLSMFSRLLIDSLLPANIERLIYLDCDTILQQDIISLWKFELQGKTIGAVDDMRTYRYCRNLGMKRDSHYINSGVILIDMKKYREYYWEERMLNGIAKYNTYLEFPDNDLICKLMQNEIKLLPPKYNVISSMYMGDYNKCMRLRSPHLYYSKKEFDEAKSAPVIIHYTTCFAFVGRPWNQGCTHPQKKVFETCYEKTPWRDVSFKSINQKSLDYVRKVYNILPDYWGIIFIWFLHSWLKPNIQYITRKRYKYIFKL